MAYNVSCLQQYRKKQQAQCRYGEHWGMEINWNVNTKSTNLYSTRSGKSPTACKALICYKPFTHSLVYRAGVVATYTKYCAGETRNAVGVALGEVRRCSKNLKSLPQCCHGQVCNVLLCSGLSAWRNQEINEPVYHRWTLGIHQQMLLSFPW